MESSPEVTTPVSIAVEDIEHQGLRFKLVRTFGLSGVEQQVPAASDAFKHIELGMVFDFGVDSEMLTQAEGMLQRLVDSVQQNGGWLGHGHTLSTQEPVAGLPFNHFILMLPWSVFLTPHLPENMLLLVPIHEKELKFKQHEGTRLFTKRYIKAGGNEVWDAFRKPLAKRRFGLL